MTRPDLHLLRLSVFDWDALADVLRQREKRRANEQLSKENMRQWKNCRDWANWLEKQIRNLSRIENLELHLPLPVIRAMAEACCEHNEVRIAERIWVQLELGRVPEGQAV